MADTHLAAASVVGHPAVTSTSALTAASVASSHLHHTLSHHASSSSSSTTTSTPFSTVLPPLYREMIRNYLRDDVPTFDVGGFVVGDTPEVAKLLCKTTTVLAGVPFFNAVFEELGCTVEWLNNIAEGDMCVSPSVVAKVYGPVRCLLLGERTALNILSRASGIAHASREVVDIAKKEHKWHGEVAGTRKVTPGFRLIEKYALLVGGASTHRMDLSHMVMLKDNHVWAAGSITAAVKKAKLAAGFSSKIEVEARNLTEALEAASAGADIVMLDNYKSPKALISDAEKLKQQFPHILVEASGGIRKETVHEFCSPFIDVVSIGALTHGYDVADFSLKIDKGAGSASIQHIVDGGGAGKGGGTNGISGAEGKE